MAAEEFDEMGTARDFLNTVGAVESMHLRVEVKEHQRVAYYNYLHWHSIHLQGICDANHKFIDVFVGWTGRTHDAVVWKKSPICEDLSKLLNVEGRLLVNTYHIVGDTAYPCSNEVMTPFRIYGGVLSQAKKKYNQHPSSKHNVIERAFKLLVQRFPRLRNLQCKSMEKMWTWLLQPVSFTIGA